jgi:hypothetical protein
VLNIQTLVVRSLPHSSSSLERVERNAYNEKIQFEQMIIQDINTTKTFVVEFLCRSRQHRRVREKIGPRATLINLVCIQELEEYEVEEHHFVEGQTMQKDAREENIVVQKEQLFIKV